jgi:sRNA-binding regulator protein Hfq
MRPGNGRSRLPEPINPRRDPRIRERAEELAHQGIPFQMAMAVATGKLALSEALERMLLQDKVVKLADQHGLSRALATQVAIGHASLDQVLARRRFEEHRDLHAAQSCLANALGSGTPIALGLHGQRRVIGKITAVDAYEFTIQPDEGPPEVVHKLQAKYAYAPDDWKKVRKGLGSDKELSKAPQPPVTKPQDRYAVADRRLFACLDDKRSIDVTLLEGEVFTGQVDWFARFEFGLKTKGDGPVTIFRHAVHRLLDS